MYSKTSSYKLLENKQSWTYVQDEIFINFLNYNEEDYDGWWEMNKTSKNFINTRNDICINKKRQKHYKENTTPLLDCIYNCNNDSLK